MGSFWDHFGTILGAFWNTFWGTLGNFGWAWACDLATVLTQNPSPPPPIRTPRPAENKKTLSKKERETDTLIDGEKEMQIYIERKSSLSPSKERDSGR